jgi:hypothetical protein
VDPDTLVLTCDQCGKGVLLRTAVIFHKDVGGYPIAGQHKVVDHFVGLCLECVTQHGDDLHANGYDAISTQRFMHWPVG